MSLAKLNARDVAKDFGMQAKAIIALLAEYTKETVSPTKILTDRELSAFRRRRIGFIFQQFHLLPVLTARENIIMPLLLDRRQPDEGYLQRLAGLLGIRERLTHLPHELSGGQQQRVAIARALIAGPDVVFADEPTGNLDSRSGGEVMSLLQTVHQELGKALVMITHDSRIAALAPRRLSIVDGILSEVAG